MTRPLLIVGCGGFGREVLSMVRAAIADGAAWEFVGFVDDAPSHENTARVRRLGTQILGGLSVLEGLERCDVIVAVGEARSRRAIVAKCPSETTDFPALVHPDATIGADVEFAEGVVVAPGARISTHVALGRHVHVDQNATIAHDVVLGDFARISPAASLTGGVHVGDQTLIGAGAVVLPGIRIGERAVVGAGAVVTVDVAPGQVVRGVPAR